MRVSAIDNIPRKSERTKAMRSKKRLINELSGLRRDFGQFQVLGFRLEIFRATLKTGFGIWDH
jgi:hypothetical protein